MHDLHKVAAEPKDVMLPGKQRTDSERAATAIQQMVDALASLPALERFVPAALRIVAQAFETKDCAYFEHRRGDPIRLRYWFYNGKVFGPEDIRSFGDDHEFADFRSMEAGFSVPDEYLGVPFRKRIKASILNHELHSPPNEYHELSRRLNWIVLLNVPLVIAGEADGALVIHRGSGAVYAPSEIELAERLAQPLALAMEVDRITLRARQAAAAQERELAANAKIEQLAETDLALQQTTDALAAMPDLENFIPAALQIMARVFRAKDCQYYEHRNGDPIRLRYWLYEGRVMGPEEIANFADEEFAVMRENAKGFNLTDDYLGMSYRRRTKAIIVNHAERSPRTFRDEFCIKHGWEMELNVPLVVSGEADGALVICRKVDSPYSASEISLAERLAQQLALAMEVDRLSAAAKQTAVAKEREKAARERTAELSKANALLRSTLEKFADERDLHTFPRAILQMAMEQSGARDGVIFILEKDTNMLCAAEYVGSPDSPRASTQEFSRPFPIDSAPMWANALAARSPVVYDVESDGHMLLPGAADWHRQRGNHSVLIAPMLINAEAYGYFGMGLEQRAQDVSEVELGLIQALTQQASLAIQLTRLAEETKQKALAQEREKSAEERAQEFANANEVLRSTLDQLSKEDDLHSFPRTILREAMKHTGARDGLILLYDQRTDTLNRSEYINAGGLPPSPEFSAPFPASGTPAWNALLSERCPIVFDVEENASMLLPGLAAWHRQHHNRSIVAAAMFIGSEPYGYFGITLGERASEVSKVKVGLIHALMQQATLAIQLTQLAEASHDAAMMVERQQVVVQERANMARDIHDRLAQGYAAILMQQHTMRRSLLRATDHPGLSAPLLEQLDIIEQLSRENLADARRTMDELHVDPFGPGDLAHTLEQCVRQLSHERDFTVPLQMERDLPPIRRYVMTEVCRIVSEAITNARKHSRSGSARVFVNKQESGLNITVQDDGVGFDTESAGPSFGIASMQERAARAGADLKIISEPGHGTTVQILLTT